MSTYLTFDVDGDLWVTDFGGNVGAATSENTGNVAFFPAAAGLPLYHAYP